MFTVEYGEYAKWCSSVKRLTALSHGSHCSPVIKVGSKTGDERTDKDTDSDEECQLTFFKNKKVKSNLF